MGYFSRCPVDTFKRAVVDLFIGLLVCVFPVLIFLPGLVVEAGTCEDGGRWGCVKRLFHLRLVLHGSFIHFWFNYFCLVHSIIFIVSGIHFTSVSCVCV